jgi:alpha-glucosidase
VPKTHHKTHHWWQSGIVYQVYPRSFQDSNHDGIGDLKGITARLDYLVELGIDAVWISPIYPSPMADFGYDVSDHLGIDPMFGTLAEFDALVAAAHARGLKIILDFVPNHTSDQHPWFVESRSSRSNAKRDWYIWRDGKSGGVPNNWVSEFGGGAWEWDADTAQYYYHAFLKEQPDLNWRNPAVRDAMLDVLRFWLDRGVDGFRVDAIHHLIEAEHLRDNPPNPDWREGQSPARRLARLYSLDQDETHDAIAAMRALADSYPDRVLIGEASLPIEQLMAYYGVGEPGFHLPFNFHLIKSPWEPRLVAALIEQYESALADGAERWPNWVLGNHDRSRVASRVGREQARVAAMLLLTLRGTPTIYQGEELGMQDVPIPTQCVRDPWEKNVPGLGLGRDPERTPMQWDAGEKAGFTAGDPWLPLSGDRATVNVQTQRADPRSMLSLYRALIALRRREPALSIGVHVKAESFGAILTYRRFHAGRWLTVALNFSDAPQEFANGVAAHDVLISTHLDRSAREHGCVHLRANEGVVLAQAA